MLVKAVMKTKPVLKAELVGNFNRRPLKSWTYLRHDVKVMFSWNFMKTWLNVMTQRCFKGLPLKLPANSAFKTGFVFITAFTNIKIWTFYYIFVNIRDNIKRACRQRGPVGKREKWHVGKSDQIKITSNIKMSQSYEHFVRFWRS